MRGCCGSGVAQTHTHTDKASTVTLAAHARRRNGRQCTQAIVSSLQ